MTMLSHKMTIPIGYYQANDGKRLPLKGKLLPVQKITNCNTPHMDTFPDAELMAGRPKEDRADACEESMNDNYR